MTLGYYTNTKGTEHLHEPSWVNNGYITTYNIFILAFLKRTVDKTDLR